MDSVTMTQGMGAIDATRDSRSKDLQSRAESLSGKSFSEHVNDSIEVESSHKSAYQTEKEKRLKKLKDVCVEEESLFVSQMLKQMRKTVEKGDLLHGGQTEEIFEDMLYDQYALNLSKSANLGIAKMMYEQLSRNM
jgi:flagellar protein FlgJ